MSDALVQLEKINRPSIQKNIRIYSNDFREKRIKNELKRSKEKKGNPKEKAIVPVEKPVKKGPPKVNAMKKLDAMINKKPTTPISRMIRTPSLCE